ncbi:Coenzyme F420 hydrogenase/dehydrogenase, beta subunit C-terminal domain [Clostridium thailandense]|uniref:Coenzyme F420 hydrogenase/dehydrogenase, beta subunit C-terminal domain n=1 Tax=Clostridium thailandense TaxID=2794346 RepID=UPI003989FB14
MKNSAIDEIGQEKCTGCFGCFNSCNVGAISMEISKEGFYYPLINDGKCVSCGKCNNNCPVISFKSDNYDKDKIKAYAGYTLDEDIRMESSSGGIFSELANYVLEQYGVVFGAKWNKNIKVNHSKVCNKQDLKELRSSKYVQSNIGNVYKNVLEELDRNKKVLFVGVPCQVAALKTFTQSESLIAVDLICHGVPSMKVFESYLQSKSRNKKVNSVNFRDKSKGWTKYCTKISFEDGSQYLKITREDPFFHGFICDLYLNSSCYDCKFASIPRSGDITIADFWQIDEELMDERGISLILTNNEKGENIIKELVKNNKIEIFEKTLEDALKGNPRIKNGHLRMRDKREECLRNIEEEGFEEISKKYIVNLKRYVY